MILVQPQTITIVSDPIGDTPVFDDSSGVFDDAGGVFDDAFSVTSGSANYMFDDYLNTQTERADAIEVYIKFNNCDRVAFFNVDATDIDLELTDDDTDMVVQTKNVDLSLGGGEYHQWVVESLYIYADATLKISINKTGSTAKCGLCRIGPSTYIGTTQYGAKFGFVDYSIKDTNSFGQTYLNQGNWAKAPEITTVIDKSIVDAVYEDLAAARGTMVIIAGNEDYTDYEVLQIFGVIEDWKIRMDNPTIAWVDLTIRGAI